MIVRALQVRHSVDSAQMSCWKLVIYEVFKTLTYSCLARKLTNMEDFVVRVLGVWQIVALGFSKMVRMERVRTGWLYGINNHLVTNIHFRGVVSRCGLSAQLTIGQFLRNQHNADGDR
jgi:hypothetical protein